MARGWESKSVESQVDDQRIAREQKSRNRSAEEIEHDAVAPAARRRPHARRRAAGETAGQRPALQKLAKLP